MVEAAVFKLAYEVDRNQLYLRAFGRDVEGHRVDVRISGTEPYFFALASEADRIRNLPEVVSITPGPPNTTGLPTVRVRTRYPFDVPDVRKHLSWHGEADVTYTRRTRGEYHLNYLDLPAPIVQDGGISVKSLRPLSSAPNIKPRVLDLDIEVEDSFGFSRPEKPENPVLSVGFFDTQRRAYGCIYAGPAVDPEAVRKLMQANIPSNTPVRIEEPIRLFPMGSEHDVLAGFGDLLAKVEPDIVSAYNGEKYDFPYLAGRTERLLLSEPTNLDLLRVFRTFEGGKELSRSRYVMADPLAIFRKQELKQRSFSLESVATDFLGYGKIERPGTVGELRRTDVAKFIAYNLFDVHLLHEIDKKRRLVDYALRIAAVANVEIPDILHNSRVVDGVLFDVARESGTPAIAMPSADFAPKGQRIGKGAEVFPVIAGLHEAVIAIDFSEEYPALMQTFNISPETRVPAGTPGAYNLPTGGTYRKEPKGIVSKGLSRLRAVRKVAKADVRRFELGSPEREEADTISKAVKFIVNSVPGVLGSEHWRLGSVEMFEDITGLARLQLKTKKRLLESPEWLSPVLGFPAKGVVISGDTDSTYVKIYREGGDQVTDLDFLNGTVVPKLLEGLNAAYQRFVEEFGATENFTADSVEGIFERFRTLPPAGAKDSEAGAKKRYFGLFAFDEGRDVRQLPFSRRVKYSGIEVKRRNNAAVTKRVQTKIVELVLTGRPTSDVIEYLDSVREDALQGKIDEEFLIPVSLSKERNVYKSKPDFVRAIDNYQSLTGRVVFPGDEFHWCFVRDGVRYAKNPGGGGEQFDEFAIPYSMSLAEARLAGFFFEVDRPKMIEKSIDGPARNVAPEIEGSTAEMSEEW